MSIRFKSFSVYSLIYKCVMLVSRLSRYIHRTNKLSKMRERILDRLASLKLEYSIVTHDPVISAKDATEQNAINNLDGVIVKNILCKDKNEKYIILSTSSEKTVDLGQLGKTLQLKKLRLAPEESLQTLFGIQRGSLAPFTLPFFPDVKIYFDKSIVNKDLLIHPLDNTATIKISFENLKKFSEPEEISVLAFDEQKKVIPTKKENPISSSSSLTSVSNELGITVLKNLNPSEWYSQILVKSEMIDYYDVSGCYILRPWSFFMWETIQEWFNFEIKAIGVQNTSFPLFVTEAALSKEEQHLEGFAAEVAWVTRNGNKDLPEPLAIRPTSETIMYPAFAKWVRSHRDLPILINQWTNVVRWEFRQPTPFIRNREFLWQEGHTAHCTENEAEKMAQTAHELYHRLYKEVLAIPTVKGYKSHGERFAGATNSYSVEGYIKCSGRGIQGATSHMLGTNFSKMYNITYSNERCETDNLAWQTSWGVSTRSIGVMVYVHGDNKGLILPPRVAPKQVVIIPVVGKTNQQELFQYCNDIQAELTKIGIRVTVDNDSTKRPGWKYNYWELRGVPCRLELGSSELRDETVTMAWRDAEQESLPKITLTKSEFLSKIHYELDTFHDRLYKRAETELNDNMVVANNWGDIITAIANKKLVLLPWCETIETEEEIKEKSCTYLAEYFVERDIPATISGGIKPLCIPIDEKFMTPPGTTCFMTGVPVTRYTLFGRSY